VTGAHAAHDELVDVETIDKRTNAREIDQAADPVENRPALAQHSRQRPSPRGRDQDQPRRGLRCACRIFEGIARGVAGCDDRMGMRGHRRQQKRQEGRIGIGRPVDLRPRATAKSRPVHAHGRIARGQTLRQRAHLMMRGDRAERRQKQQRRSRSARGDIQADVRAAPVPLQCRCRHASRSDSPDLRSSPRTRATIEPPHRIGCVCYLSMTLSAAVIRLISGFCAQYAESLSALPFILSKSMTADSSSSVR